MTLSLNILEEVDHMKRNVNTAKSKWTFVLVLSLIVFLVLILIISYVVVR